jgi:hypothetical protein
VGRRAEAVQAKIEPAHESRVRSENV